HGVDPSRGLPGAEVRRPPSWWAPSTGHDATEARTQGPWATPVSGCAESPSAAKQAHLHRRWAASAVAAEPARAEERQQREPAQRLQPARARASDPVERIAELAGRDGTGAAVRIGATIRVGGAAGTRREAVIHALAQGDVRIPEEEDLVEVGGAIGIRIDAVVSERLERGPQRAGLRRAPQPPVLERLVEGFDGGPETSAVGLVAHHAGGGPAGSGLFAQNAGEDRGGRGGRCHEADPEQQRAERGSHVEPWSRHQKKRFTWLRTMRLEMSA